MRDWLDQGAAEAGVVSLPTKGLDTGARRTGHGRGRAGDNRLANWSEVDYAELAKEPFIRSTGAARRCTPRSRGGPASSSTSPSKHAKCRQCSRSSGRASASASCRVPGCLHCRTCGRAPTGSPNRAAARYRRLRQASAPARAFLEEIGAKDPESVEPSAEHSRCGYRHLPRTGHRCHCIGSII